MAIKINPEEVIPNTVDSDELGRVDGVTSNIQDQLDDKMTISLASEAEDDFIIKGAANWENTDRESVLLAMHNMNKYAIIKEDFHNVPNTVTDPFRRYSSGAGSGAYLTFPTAGNQVGLGYALAGAVTNNYCGFGSKAAVIFLAGNGPVIFETSLKARVADDGSDSQRIRIGFINAFTIALPYDVTIGAWFEGELGVNAKWRTVTLSNGGGGATKVTSVDVNDTALDYMNFMIVINSDASQFDFYINDTLETTHSTALGDDIPNDGSTDRLSIGLGIRKSASSAAVSVGLYVDRIQAMWYCGADRK